MHAFVVMPGKDKEPKEERSVQPQPAATESNKTAPAAREEGLRARVEGGVRAAGLDQLREILFGAIYRDFDRRLARADAQLAARANELQQEHRKRIEVLETHLRRETEALASRVEREHSESDDSIRNLTREHRDALASLSQRVAKIEESLTVAQRELRHELLDQAKSFLDEMQRMRREILSTLERELGAESDEAEELGHDGHADRPSP